MSRPSPESPEPSPPDSVIVALVIGAHGRDGCINVRLLSDLPGRFDPGRELLLDGRPCRILRSRQTGPDTALLWLDAVTARRHAVPLAGKYLSARPESAALPDGEYFHYQLIGMRVIADDGEDLGEIREILETGSNDVYIVRGGDGGELLIPATAQVVRQVDPAAGVMRVLLPDGLR